MKTAILFDMDGTLLDTLADLHQAVNHALTHCGYPERTLEEVCRFVGNGAGQLIRLAVPEGGDREAVMAEFQRYYAAHCNCLTKPYDGIPEALAILGRTYPLAIVSNKPDIAAKALANIYFPGIFALGESSRCLRKPAADMVLVAMEELGVERCVYVGDSDVDIRTAENAHVPCLSVTWGFRGMEELTQAGATHFCHRPEDLPAAIDKILQEP